jgi:uncharacterized LabA/DUF88 family protein
MMEQGLASLFIDFDNIYVSLVNDYGYSRSKAQGKTIIIIGNALLHVENELGLTPIIREAIADWSMYPDVPNELYTMGVRVAHIKSTVGKNSADIELSLRLQEIMLTRSDIDVLIVLAGDRDYLPVAQRVHENGKRIVFCSFERCLSGDIKMLVGKNNYWFINPDTSEIVTDKDTKKKARTEKPRKKTTGPELDDNCKKALRAAITAEEEYGPKFGSVRLSGFLVDKLAKALPEKSHLERKDIFSQLVDRDLIRLKTESDRHGEDFTVFNVNKKNPVVRSIGKNKKGKL